MAQEFLVKKVDGVTPNASGEVELLAAKQDGTILWHSARWFTQAGTLASTGTIVTLTGSTQLTASMVGAKISKGSEKRIITAYLTTSTCTIDRAFSSDGGGITDWGVFSKSQETTSAGVTNFYRTTGNINTTINAGGNVTYYSMFHIFNRGLVGDGYISGHRDYFFNFDSSTNAGAGTKVLGFRMSALGQLEIYDGTTLGTLRDLKLRGLRAGNVLETKLTVATTGSGITTLTVDQTTNFPATGTVLIGGVTSVAYTARTATTITIPSTSIPAYAIGTSVLCTSAGTYTQINSIGGLELAKMTTSEINAISSPANGLMIYNTTLNLPCFYNGTSWQRVTSSSM